MSHATEILVTCPYDKAHRILRSRLQTHLVKCSKNHVLSEYTICPYDSSHRVLRAELKDHTATCNAAIRLEKDFYVTDSAIDKPVIPPPNSVSLPEPEENWEDDDFVGYNPQEHGAKKATFRTLRVESAARRRQFRMEHRLEVKEMELENPSESCKQQNLIQLPADDKPLRKPLGPPESLVRLEKKTKELQQVCAPSTIGRGRGSVLPNSQETPRVEPQPVPKPAIAMNRPVQSFWLGLARGRAAAAPTALRRPNTPEQSDIVNQIGRGRGLSH